LNGNDGGPVKKKNKKDQERRGTKVSLRCEPTTPKGILIGRRGPVVGRGKKKKGIIVMVAESRVESQGPDYRGPHGRKKKKRTAL